MDREERGTAQMTAIPRFFMYTGVQRKYVSRADGRSARRAGEVTFPTRLYIAEFFHKKRKSEYSNSGEIVRLGRKQPEVEEMRAITIIEAKEQQAKENTIMLDIRPSEYYQEYHIPEAVNISYDRIEEGDYYLPDEYSYLLYCEHGTQSMTAGRLLEADRFQTMSVIGGMTAYYGWADRER